MIYDPFCSCEGDNFPQDQISMRCVPIRSHGQQHDPDFIDLLHYPVEFRQERGAAYPEHCYTVRFDPHSQDPICYDFESDMPYDSSGAFYSPWFEEGNNDYACQYYFPGQDYSGTPPLWNMTDLRCDDQDLQHYFEDTLADYEIIEYTDTQPSNDPVTATSDQSLCWLFDCQPYDPLDAGGQYPYGNDDGGDPDNNAL